MNSTISYCSYVKLTPREKDIAKAILLYAEQKRVAKFLNLTPGTVRAYCSILRTKFGVTKTFLAAQQAKSKGLLD